MALSIYSCTVMYIFYSFEWLLIYNNNPLVVTRSFNKFKLPPILLDGVCGLYVCILSLSTGGVRGLSYIDIDQCQGSHAEPYISKRYLRNSYQIRIRPTHSLDDSVCNLEAALVSSTSLERSVVMFLHHVVQKLRKTLRSHVRVVIE
jgi:hypothetical protein